MIGILDYKLGNLRSVQKALEKVGGEATIVSEPGALDQYAGLILPGVGAYADGMRYLDELGFIDPVKAYAASGKPVLGVCLGFQLLFEGSEEDAQPGQMVPGLGLLPGRVVRFACDRAEASPRLKVPHMGWNTLDITEPGCPLLAGIEPGSAVYFVHGYHAADCPDDVVAATTDYDGPFCSVAHRGNLYATQFHPEKSQKVGLALLSNFARLTGSKTTAGAAT